MITVTSDTRPAGVDVAVALAADAWARLCRRVGRPVTVPIAVVPLKPQKLARKSGIYRLEGAGELGTPVIAKRCLRGSALIERHVYERLLPAIGLPSLTFFGSADDAEHEYCWLFLEDAGEVKLTEHDRALAAHWVARLHTSAAALAGELSLPDRGERHYHEQLRAALADLERSVAIARLSADCRAMLEGLRRRLDQVDARWESLCQPCAALPRTLVHGDFSRKNCRVRTTAAGPTIIALDWETAGWGPPAADLAGWSRPSRKAPNAWRGTVAIDVYASAVGASWPGVTLHDVEQQSLVGTIFRVIAATHWASETLQAGGTLAGLYKLAPLEGALDVALAAVDI
jgi:hypothetical protein